MRVRWGKTWSVALFVVALLLCVPGIQIGVFSTGKRASGSLMAIVCDFLQRIPGASERIVKKNEEQLFISHGKGSGVFDKDGVDTRTSKLFSYPGSTTGLIYTHHTLSHSLTLT